MHSGALVSDVNAAMACLAAELQDRGLVARLIPAGGGPPRLRVINPAAIGLSEMIIGHAGAFWWPWRDQIGPASEVAYVASVIARVLATT